MSPIVTFLHNAFQHFCFAIINSKQVLRPSPHLNPADTSIHTCIHSLPCAIHSTPTKISQVVIFQLKCHQLWHFHTEGISACLHCHNQCQTGTQTIPPSQSSWRIHSHLRTFTSASYSFNPNKNITSGDIFVKMSPAVTFSHRLHSSIVGLQ